MVMTFVDKKEQLKCKVTSFFGLSLAQNSVQTEIKAKSHIEKRKGIAYNRLSLVGLFLTLSLTAPSYALTINPIFVSGAGETWTAERMGVVNQAITDWGNSILDSYSIDVTFGFSSAGDSGYLAQWSGSYSYSTGDDIMPWSSSVSHSIHFNADWFDNSTYSWFDPTPHTDGDLTSSHYDMLSVARHELGHVLGFADGFYGNNLGTAVEELVWDNLIDSSNIFDAGAGGLNVSMDGSDHAHTLNAGTTFHDLMNPSIYNGERRGISSIDLEMLSRAYGYTIVSAVPIPAAAWLFGSGLLGLLGFSRLKTAEV